MPTGTLIVLLLALLGYLVGGGLATLNYFELKKTKQKFRQSFLWSGFALHSAGFILLAKAQETAQLFHNFQANLVLMIWLAMLIFLVTNQMYKISALILFFLPLVILGFIGVFFLPVDESRELESSIKALWLVAHIIPIFLGFACFSIASLLGVLYLIMSRQLKRKKMGRLFKSGISLELLEKLNKSFLYIGLPCMSIGILLGLIFLRLSNKMPEHWYLDTGILAGVVTWSVYVITVIAWMSKKVSRRVIVFLNLAGLALVILSFIPGKFHDLNVNKESKTQGVEKSQ